MPVKQHSLNANLLTNQVAVMEMRKDDKMMTPMMKNIMMMLMMMTMMTMMTMVVIMMVTMLWS